MEVSKYQPFKTLQKLEQWLKLNHQKETELWVQLYKKDSGTPSVTWEDCVVACLIWGWIDGHKKALDEVSFLQRLTPRRPKSNWSKKNCGYAEKLIAEGRMQPAGLAHVEAARKDGRWENAYAGSADMVIPEEFLRAALKVPAAKKFFDTLDRANLYAIYHRLQTAKRQETRQRRIDAIVSQLAQGKPLHPMAAQKLKPATAEKPRAHKPRVELLAGGNPRIAKAEGDAPVQAYMDALPGWKRELAQALDTLIVRAVPKVHKAVKWNSPFYGLPGKGWFLAVHTFTNYLKVAFFKGTELNPMPPGVSKGKETRYLDIREGELDDKQLTQWVKQAAALPGWLA
jgi:uncharacterized protein YdeI (YjbR/CyaY-like superfamily)